MVEKMRNDCFGAEMANRVSRIFRDDSTYSVWSYVLGFKFAVVTFFEP